MATLQVKNIPDEMYERLRKLAKDRQTTISATVINAVEREIRSAAWRERWQSRPEIDLGVDGAALVKKARASNGVSETVND